MFVPGEHAMMIICMGTFPSTQHIILDGRDTLGRNNEWTCFFPSTTGPGVNKPEINQESEARNPYVLRYAVQNPRSLRPYHCKTHVQHTEDRAQNACDVNALDAVPTGLPNSSSA